MKALLEVILGRNSFRQVKDYADLRDWKKESSRLLTAVGLAISDSVFVVDPQWMEEVSALISHGHRRLEIAQDTDDLFAALAATLGELVFLQIGCVPRGHRNVDRAPL